MSIGNSKKEFLFSIYISLNKDIIEKQLGIDIKQVYLEKWVQKRKVDMNCITNEGERLLIEVQMDITSYKEHLRQIQGLIAVANINENTIIVYAMLDFKKDIIMELMQNVVFYSEKNIRLVFLKINTVVLEMLTEINKLGESDRLKELKKLNTVDEIFVDEKDISTYNKLVSINKAKDTEYTTYNYEQRLLIDIAKRLREDCGEVSTNVYQFKEVKNNNFIIGSGFQDIVFKVSSDRKKTVSIQLCFSGNKKEIFYRLLSNQEDIQDYFNYVLKFDEKFEKIWTSYPISWFHSDREIMIKRFCRDVKTYLAGFNKYLKQAIEEE